jgi:transcriptional regulator with XRE-family HTH domain
VPLRLGTRTTLGYDLRVGLLIHEEYIGRTGASGVVNRAGVRNRRQGAESGRGAESQKLNTSVGLRGPFVIRLRGRIPHPAGYPEDAEDPGRPPKARLDRGIPQRDAARAIGSSPLTFFHWEKGRVAPDVRFWPAILAFLRYDPRPEPAAFGGHIRAAREAEGLSERELARRLGLDPDTVAVWGRGEMSPAYSRTWWVFERYLATARKAE